MEWLNDLIPGLIGAVGVPLALWGINLALPKKRTRDLGFKIGRAMSVFGQKKAGKGYEKIETRLQTTLHDFVEGVQAGLDKDDNATN